MLFASVFTIFVDSPPPIKKYFIKYFIYYLYPLHLQDGTLYHVQTEKCVEALQKVDNGSPGPALSSCTGSAHQQWFFKERT